jgi:hypothetical protein
VTKRSDAEFELVDIKDFDLPLLDDPMTMMSAQRDGRAMPAPCAGARSKIAAVSAGGVS